VPHPAPEPEILFYDGHCALCHRGVKFVLKHDRTGAAFRFAPLQGPTFQSAVPSGLRAALPDSMIVQTLDGRLLLRSAAWVHIMRRLGGGWAILAGLLFVIPRPLRDWGYDVVAATRIRIFGRRDDLCPLVPPELRGRFDP
jgi:predicted DCC family thiol-disulfide oxidoreductase YuxK